MKIPESIIAKYQLTPSGEQAGESFIHNLIIYKTSIPGFDNIRIMECDLNGRPTDNITIFNRVSRNIYEFTEEFMRDIDYNTVFALVNKR